MYQANITLMINALTVTFAVRQLLIISPEMMMEVIHIFINNQHPLKKKSFVSKRWKVALLRLSEAMDNKILFS